MMLEFRVDLAPVAQPRQQFWVLWPSRRQVAEASCGSPLEWLRWFRTHARIRPRGQSTDSPIQTYKAVIARAALAAAAGVSLPIDAPIEVRATFALPRPQARRWKKKLQKSEWHSRRPDLDNLVKALLDALQPEVLSDDARVVRLVASKLLAPGDTPDGFLAVTICEADAL